MSNNLLQKGIISTDDSIFHGSAGDHGKEIITEEKALSRLVFEHRSLHFCLGMTHFVLCTVIAIHFFYIMPSLGNENDTCMIINPSSYSFFFAFGIVTLIASILCLRHARNNKQYSAWFFDQIKKLYYLDIILGCCTMAFLILSSKLCQILQVFNAWPFVWGAFCVVEALVLLLYTNWYVQELQEFGGLQENSTKERLNSTGTELGLDDSRIVRELNTTTNQGDQSKDEVSMTSITTV